MEAHNNPQEDVHLPAVDAGALSQQLSAVLDEIHLLIELAPDDQAEGLLRQQRSVYFALLEKVTQHEIDQTTPLYLEALESLKLATKAAADAKMDINKIADAINKVVDATKALDKFAQLGIKFLA